MIVVGGMVLALAGCAGISHHHIEPKQAKNLRLKELRAVRSAAQLGQAAIPIGTAAEIQIGRAAAARVAGRFGVDSDPALTRYITLIGTAVANASNRADLPYRFAVLDTDEINAFATPGGFVFVTRGAIRQARDEAQIAGILGHEIAHISQRHIVKEIQKAGLLQATVASGAGLIFEADPALFQTLADFSVDLLFKGLGKEAEYEADQLGLEYAARLGYHAGALREFLMQLPEPQYATALLSRLFATHPAPADRIQNLDRHLQRYFESETPGTHLADRFSQSTTGFR